MLRPLSDELRSLLCASAAHPRHVLAASTICRRAADRVQRVLLGEGRMVYTMALLEGRQAVERVATERGVRPVRNVEHRKLQGTELGTLGQVVLPVTLRAHVWADLQALDPLFEACRIPRKARQTGSDDIDNASARSLLMRGARSPLPPSDRVLRLTA